MSIQHLTTEQSYWRKIVEPLCQPARLWWDIQVSYVDRTAICKIASPTQSKAFNKNPDLIAKIDVDREHRSEAEIMADIEKAVAEKSAI